MIHTVHAMRLIASITCLLLLLLLLLSQASQARDTIVVDSLAEWKAPTVHVGDSLVFKHGQFQNLYLFHSRRAFDLCDFNRSTPMYNGSPSHFTWRPSRPGYYYLAVRDPPQQSCDSGEKAWVRVLTPDPSPVFPSLPAPAPTSGADLPSSPSTAWGASPSPAPSLDLGPLRPKERQLAPAVAPSSGNTGSVPFISSSPAVPLPVGETDTATILPFTTPESESQVVVGAAASCVAARVSLLMALMMLAFELVLSTNSPLLRLFFCRRHGLPSKLQLVTCVVLLFFLCHLFPLSLLPSCLVTLSSQINRPRLVET